MRSHVLIGPRVWNYTHVVPRFGMPWDALRHEIAGELYERVIVPLAHDTDAMAAVVDGLRALEKIAAEIVHHSGAVTFSNAGIVVTVDGRPDLTERVVFEPPPPVEVPAEPDPVDLADAEDCGRRQADADADARGEDA